MKKKGWFWLIFLILLMALLAVLALRYNVISFQRRTELLEPVLGTIGFLIIMLGMIFFFVRLAQEMRLSELQSEFLAAVTHELKTPIATLELSSSLLRDDRNLSEEDRRKLWNSHQEELKRLRQEVEMLLEAARWDAKAFRLSRTEIDLCRWLETQKPRWKSILGENSSLEVHVGTATRLVVMADEHILKLIAENLIDNARKFARERPAVEVKLYTDDEEWAIVFRDHGWGFDPDDAKKIFKRFYRSRSFAPYSIPGSGLGLFLARSAAARMRMKVTATSEGQGKGSSFTLQGNVLEVSHDER